MAARWISRGPYICGMDRHIQLTADGSHTIAVPGMGVTYHSTRGALQESLHVFIAAGLRPLLGRHPVLRIFEAGLGTGLNALLTLQEAGPQAVYYEAVEPYPLSAAEAQALNYNEMLNNSPSAGSLQALHAAPWEQPVALSPGFTLCKRQSSLQQYLAQSLPPPFHLVYFDAFDPVAQPELWSQEVFEQLFARLDTGGVLVTYCSKGAVRRAMQAAGFKVEKLPGPPGKREIIRAGKEV
ncbi:tRNA (5-methylaminomethyl-2-thiouridine)(34)-methyltransferase MnmD [Chitinophaga japonensis]|uniref:tRNA U34 5-methylaminomethyl-2-thiouridine-forming methyltransferase MnmC n=1 Tax=Chitinophaga japonensis TaxID=104662 RepID=A0A562T7R9_CHIJA|nr:tRNA (5-methylaminomethyl-2-thiouridine)(34)-methyltransferase MnmD [Chitinophaga japonensis]TWI89046.1 tRNA U34 5-methylaminomethyl-2-thiouridine-forming methyltransferase MnmC [Chitinophaga japonensis]